MIRKTKSQCTALLKYNFAVPLFALMLVFSSATSNNFQQEPISEKVEQVEVKNSEDRVYGLFDGIDKRPMFPNGQERLNAFLEKNVKYPAADKENNLQGTVLLHFIVERNGSLTNIKVLKSPSASMSAEAIRVLKLSPKWKPGINNGKPVRSEYAMPIRFTLGTKS
jgi:periplasmic protein TonB